MNWIKNKIIKILGGVPKDEYIKDVKISYEEGCVDTFQYVKGSIDKYATAEYGMSSLESEIEICYHLRKDKLERLQIGL